MTNPEHNTSPEYNVPTWEELLAGALTLKVAPLDDPNRPSVEDSWDAVRQFRLGNGDGLTVVYGHHIDDTSEDKWGFSVFPAGKPDGHYGFELQRHEGQLRLFPDGSEIPLDISSVEHILGQVATAQPLDDTHYADWTFS